jgi:hypothetical protein
MSSTPESSTTSLVKKVRAPVLTEKYSKFIQFSYYIMSQMETDNFTKEEFLNNVKMFDTVEEQQTFIQGFFDNQKDNKKAMRKSIQDKKKENQPKKVRATRKSKKAVSNTEESNTAAAAADETVPETESITNTESQENLIESLTDELTEEPMIDKISAAIEIAEDITGNKSRKNKSNGEKKTRVVKKKTTTEPTMTPTL